MRFGVDALMLDIEYGDSTLFVVFEVIEREGSVGHGKPAARKRRLCGRIFGIVRGTEFGVLGKQVPISVYLLVYAFAPDVSEHEIDNWGDIDNFIWNEGFLLGTDLFAHAQPFAARICASASSAVIKSPR